MVRDTEKENGNNRDPSLNHQKEVSNEKSGMDSLVFLIIIFIIVLLFLLLMPIRSDNSDKSVLFKTQKNVEKLWPQRERGLYDK